MIQINVVCALECDVLTPVRYGVGLHADCYGARGRAWLVMQGAAG